MFFCNVRLILINNKSHQLPPFVTYTKLGPSLLHSQMPTENKRTQLFIIRNTLIYLSSTTATCFNAHSLDSQFHLSKNTQTGPLWSVCLETNNTTLFFLQHNSIHKSSWLNPNPLWCVQNRIKLGGFVTVRFNARHFSRRH